MLSALDGSVKIVARERRSYKYVKKFLSPGNVFVADDMALKIPDYDSEVARMRQLKPSEKNIGYMFRTDKARTIGHLPESNVDISEELKLRVRETARDVLSTVTDYSEVWTNRCHVCIAASLMDRETRCFPNSFWKVQAVFEFSLKGRFPHTHLALKPPKMLLSTSEKIWL
mmetsp:Transcript_18128/g.41803  ORF Transcript_18128/g.41803 Transcript_18128/m.41803 type:complete len:171 (+) Transcript_18128:154-666(+)